MKKWTVLLIMLLARCILSASEPRQGTHLKWGTEYITEKMPNGERRVGLVKIFMDGQQVGLLDPRNLPINRDDWGDECLPEDPNCYPPGVMGRARVLALSPDEKRLIFFVNTVPDGSWKFFLYFDIETKKIIPLGRALGDELTGFTFGPDPSYAYVNADYLFIVMNFKKNTIQEIPPLNVALEGEVSVPPDVVVISDGTWPKTNILSFRFHADICQNRGVEVDIGDRVFLAMPERSCIYNFDSGETQILNTAQMAKIISERNNSSTSAKAPKAPKKPKANKAKSTPYKPSTNPAQSP